ATLTILLLFSGFSIFAVPPMLALILWTGTQAWRHADARLAIACLLSTLTISAALASFASGYVLTSTIPRWFSTPWPWLYLIFVSQMLGYVFWMPDWPRSGAAVGWLTLAVLVWAFLNNFRRIVIARDHWCPQSVIGFLFTSFTLLYCFATA